jgi:orotidine-5'-phosphate decarboxylase
MIGGHACPAEAAVIVAREITAASRARSAARDCARRVVAYAKMALAAPRGMD